MEFATDPSVGRIAKLDVDAGSFAYVMTGNPRIVGEDFSIRAQTIVVWLDKTDAPDLGGGLLDLAPVEPAGTPATAAGTRPRGKATVLGGGAAGSAIPKALLGIYAEGAVELVSGELSFRADALYVDPRTSRALLIEPRFESRLAVKGAPDPVPVFVRAQEARIVAPGVAVFQTAEVTTSRANDRVLLNIASLRVEEFEDEKAKGPLLMGFRTLGSQRFTGQGIEGRAEGVPVFAWNEATFGSKGMRDFPLRLRGVTAGGRSSFGRYAMVALGSQGPRGGDDPWYDWTVAVGGYTKRGPALGGDLKWDRRSATGGPSRVQGRLQTFGIVDLGGEDRTGFRPADVPRAEVLFENRWDPAPAWRVDAEANAFSDRGIHREFFETDERNHKERETYGRVRWREGGTAATATAGVHAREFATESLGQPELALWSESRPLTAAGSPVALDLSSAATASRMARRFDADLLEPGYEATRIDVTERLFAPFGVGDVRISPFVGARITSYTDRTDGGDDVTRSALETGIRANLQLSRDWDLVGGHWRLDGLRHVIDLDAGVTSRLLDDVRPEDVPYFDRVDAEEDRTEVFLEVRNRLETRRTVVVGHDGGRANVRRANGTLLDLRVRAAFWPDDVGPYGRRGPGQVESWLEAELVPGRAWLRSQSLTSFESSVVERFSTGVQWNPRDDLQTAAGFRLVNDQVLAPWYDAYWHWNEKWGIHVSGIHNLEWAPTSSIKAALLRFSSDHVFEIGVSLRNSDDLGIFVNFQPAIGGSPVDSPFDPREPIEFTP